MRNYRFLIMVMVLFMVVGSTFGCGRAAEETPAVPTTPAVPPVVPAPDPPPATDPIRLTVAQTRGVQSWDPPVSWDMEEEWTIQNVYDYLFIRSADGSDWVPELAESWEPIDERTYRFHLVENAKFHDGTPLTAHDVKYHYRRILDGTREQYIIINQYLWIDHMIVHDEYTIDIVSKEPDSLFLWKLAQTNNGAGIVSSAYVEQVGPEGVHRAPMGSGPFKLVDWSRDEFILLEINEEYWRDPPNYDELMFLVIPEISTRVAELLTGGIDFMYDVRPEDVNRIEAANLRVIDVQTAMGYMLRLNTGVRSTTNYPEPDYPDDPILNRFFITEDPRIREAIELAIDKQALRDLAGGIGEPFRGRALQPLEEANPDYYGPQANLFNPDRARELIAEAGYEPGEAVLVMHADNLWPKEDTALVIREMLEEVGFSVDLSIIDRSTYVTEIHAPGKQQELTVADVGGNLNPFFATMQFHTNRRDRVPPDPSVNPLWDGQQEQLDSLLNFAWTETLDVEARNRAYHEAHSLIAEMRSIIGLFQHSARWAMNDRVEFAPRFDGDIMGYYIQYTP